MNLSRMFFLFLRQGLQQRYMLQANMTNSTLPPVKKPIFPQQLKSLKKVTSLGQQKFSGLPPFTSLKRQIRFGSELWHQSEHLSRLSSSPIVAKRAISGSERVALMQPEEVEQPLMGSLLGQAVRMVACSVELQLVKKEGAVTSNLQAHPLFWQQAFWEASQMLLAQVMTVLVEFWQSPLKKASGRQTRPPPTPKKMSMKRMTRIWKQQMSLGLPLQMPQRPSPAPPMMARLTPSMMPRTRLRVLASPRKMVELTKPQMVTARTPMPMSSMMSAPSPVNNLMRPLMILYLRFED